MVRDSGLIATSSQYANEINLQIARYFYSTNTPFSHADSAEFKNMCSMLRPGFKPPSSRKLADELLDEVHNSVMSDAKERLKNAYLSMSLDGWSNVHNEPVVCCSVTTEYGESFLVKTIDTSGNAHTSEYLKTIALEAIEETEKLFDAKVTSFVTDNTGNVAKMRRLLEENPTRSIIQYGCSAHILHLLASDVQIPGILEQIVKVIKYFRNTHLPAAWYKQAKGKRLITPQQVRWNTASDAIESYLENRGILVQLCQDKKEFIDKDIFRIVNDINITINAKDFLQRMKPIAVSLDRMQRDGATISVAVEVWKKLENDLNEQPANVLKQFKKRKEMALTPAHYLANFCDHRFRGSHLSNEEKQAAFEYLQTLNPEFIPIIMAMSTGSNPFPVYLFGPHFQTTPPMTWWKSVNLIDAEKYFRWTELQEEFLCMCSKLLTAVAATAGLERIFSTFGLVHSKLRNKLGTEKAGKLTFMFRHFNQSKNKASNLDFIYEPLDDVGRGGSSGNLQSVSAEMASYSLLSECESDDSIEDDLPLARLAPK